MSRGAAVDDVEPDQKACGQVRRTAAAANNVGPFSVLFVSSAIDRLAGSAGNWPAADGKRGYQLGMIVKGWLLRDGLTGVCETRHITNQGMRYIACRQGSMC